MSLFDLLVSFAKDATSRKRISILARAFARSIMSILPRLLHAEAIAFSPTPITTNAALAFISLFSPLVSLAKDETSRNNSSIAPKAFIRSNMSIFAKLLHADAIAFNPTPMIIRAELLLNNPLASRVSFA